MVLLMASMTGLTAVVLVELLYLYRVELQSFGLTVLEEVVGLSNLENSRTCRRLQGAIQLCQLGE